MIEQDEIESFDPEVEQSGIILIGDDRPRFDPALFNSAALTHEAGSKMQVVLTDVDAPLQIDLAELPDSAFAPQDVINIEPESKPENLAVEGLHEFLGYNYAGNRRLQAQIGRQFRLTATSWTENMAALLTPFVDSPRAKPKIALKAGDKVFVPFETAIEPCERAVHNAAPELEGKVQIIFKKYTKTEYRAELLQIVMREIRAYVDPETCAQPNKVLKRKVIKAMAKKLVTETLDVFIRKYS